MLTAIAVLYLPVLLPTLWLYGRLVDWRDARRKGRAALPHEPQGEPSDTGG